MYALSDIVERLSSGQQRATYGAVAEFLGLVPRSLLQGRKRDWRHSWIVNQESGLPSGYHQMQMHPALKQNPRILATAAELRDWLDAGGSQAESDRSAAV
jgi:hypothetical protein